MPTANDFSLEVQIDRNRPGIVTLEIETGQQWHMTAKLAVDLADRLVSAALSTNAQQAVIEERERDRVIERKV